MQQAFQGRMAILGAVRNGGDGLAATLTSLEGLIARLSDAQVFLATNDNEDKTDAALADWSSSKPYVETIRLDGLVNSIPVREDRIALARCFLLERLVRLANPPELTLILDLDGPNIHLPTETILNIASRADGSWDAVFANQSAGYYDLWALRHPVWCPGDCWKEVQQAKKRLIGMRRTSTLVEEIIRARQFRIPADMGWIEVDSAFGGLGLYQTASLRGHWYSARDAQSRLVCEHVALHHSMKRSGARFYIAPELLNEAPKEHLGRLSGQPYPYLQEGRLI